MRCICHEHRPECTCADDSQNAVELQAAESINKKQFIGLISALLLFYILTVLAAIFYASPGAFRHHSPIKFQDRLSQTDIDSRPQICFDSYLAEPADTDSDDDLVPEDDGKYCI